MNFEEKLISFPPILARILARGDGGRILRDAEISYTSKIWEVQLSTMQIQTSWDGIDAPTMFRYLKGCLIDLESREWLNRTATYFRGDPTFKYLRQDHQWESRWMPMLIRWRSSYPERIGIKPAWRPLRRLLDRTSPLVHAK